MASTSTQRVPARVDFGGTLQCPKCAGFNLHQCDTTIFERHEDEDYTTVIAQNGKDVEKSVFPSRDTCNPSGRRHGLIVEFVCEECGDSGPCMRLGIYQHKGSTYMEWM